VGKPENIGSGIFHLLPPPIPLSERRKGICFKRDKTVLAEWSLETYAHCPFRKGGKIKFHLKRTFKFIP